MSDKAPIPNIPPLSSIQDPAARAVLQALINGWHVRNGAVGDGGERFLTVNDLKSGLSGGSGGPLNSGPRRLGFGAQVSDALSAMIDSVVDGVTSSKLWQKLGSRIDHIETPEWFRGRFGAAIKEEQILRESQFEAFASNVTTAIANLDGNQAVARNALTAISTAQSAQASDITDLQTTIGGVSLNAQQALEVSQTIEGEMEASWTVKLDADGYVAGVGLILEGGEAGELSSDFYIRSDRFAVGPPAGGKVSAKPVFIVQGGQVYINGSLFASGSITASMIDSRGLTIKDAAGNIILGSGTGLDWSKVSGAGKPADYADKTSQNVAAGIAGQGALATLSEVTGTYIKDLTVGTLKIANGAISSSSAGTGSGKYLGIGSSGILASATIGTFSYLETNAPNALVVATCRIENNTGAKKMFAVSIKRNGTNIANDSFGVRANSEISFSRQAVDTSPSSGATYTLDIYSFDSGDKYVWSPVISASLFKK